MARGEAGKIFLSQFEEFHRRPQLSAVLRVRRMFEVFLQMHERTRGLDQPLEKIIIRGLGVEPKMLQNIVRFIVTLIIPAAKVGSVKRMIGNLAGKISILTFEVAHELRNSFAFVHEAFNFTMAEMMGKPTFPEEPAVR